MRSVWKANTKVSFGYFDKAVIIWYCSVKPEVDSPDKAKENVGAACLVDTVNTCVNEAARKAHNKYRKTHAADELAYSAEMAKHIQTFMDLPGFAGVWVDPAAPLAAPCDVFGYSIYEEKDAAKVKDLAKTDVVTDTWYENKSKYDFSTERPKSGLNAELTDDVYKFTSMVWRSSTVVGFGIKDKWVIAGYCA